MNSTVFKIFIFIIFLVNIENISTSEINKTKIIVNDDGSSKTKLKEENKEKINIEILVEVLRGAGLNYLDASKAADTFRKVYPPEGLNEQSYLIMPPIGKEIQSFAVNIDGLDSVLITKKKK